MKKPATRGMRNIKALPPKNKPQTTGTTRQPMTAEQKQREESIKILVGALGFHGISVNAQAAEIMLLVVTAVNEKGLSFSFNDSMAIQEEIENKYGKS